MTNVRRLARSLGRVLSRTLSGSFGNPDFPRINTSNVYQANGADSVLTGVIPGADALDFSVTFDVYVIAHTATIRPVIGQTTAFGVPAQTSWQVLFRADNQLQLSVRNGDAVGLFADVAIPVPEGVWTTVTASYLADTLQISGGGNTDSLLVSNRQGAPDGPHNVFGQAAPATGIQLSNVDIEYVGGPSMSYPCAEGSGLVMKDYIAQDLSSVTNGAITSESIHATRR